MSAIVVQTRVPRFAVRLTISGAADLVGVHPQTLRVYERRGFICPQRTPGGQRVYSRSDIARLLEIRDLVRRYGLSSAALALVLELRDALTRSQQTIDTLRERQEAALVRGAVPVDKAARR